MLTTFRRHKVACKNTTRRERNCRCPIYCEGTLNGNPVRKALETRDWNTAQAVMHRWERQGYVAAENEPQNRMTVEAGVEKYLEYSASLHLAPMTMKKYVGYLRGNPDTKMQRKDVEPTKPLLGWATEQGLLFLDQLGVEQMRAYQTDWHLSANTATKRLQGLKGFWKFCAGAKWVDGTVIDQLKAPKEKRVHKHPFTVEEMAAILTAADQHPRAKQLRALIYLMRYSGLRIGDATQCACDRLNGDELFLYTTKANTPVFTVLPPAAVDALRECPRVRETHWFSNGAKATSDRGIWWEMLATVFKDAGVKNAHPHRFRHTFAIGLLQDGASSPEVAQLLGNTPAIVEKHYSAWVKSRQDALNNRLRSMHAKDPLASKTKGKVVQIG